MLCFGGFLSRYILNALLLKLLDNKKKMLYRLGFIVFLRNVNEFNKKRMIQEKLLCVTSPIKRVNIIPNDFNGFD